MFKTVFSRLLVIYLIVILSALVAFGIANAEMFRAQFNDERIKGMKREALAINGIMEKKWGKNRIAARDELEIIARKYNASIWVVDRYGSLLIAGDRGHPDEWIGQEGAKVPQDVLDNVLAGFVVSTTNFFGDLFPEEVRTVGQPLNINRKIEGAIFMHVKSTDIQAQIAQIYKNVAIASFIAVVLASFLIYFTAVRISRPLVEMNAVAQRFSKGDFSMRPHLTGKDEIAQLAVSLDRMADDLNDQEQMRKSFVANVSHELKSPLAAMRGFLEGMLDGTISEREFPPTLTIVLDETKRLNLLINDLLDLARIESGKFPITPSVFDINESIRRTLILSEGRINEKGLDVAVRFRQDYCFVFADKDRIEQVLRNLLDNAIKFSNDGGTLTLNTHAARQKAFITIADNGVGIPQEDLRHIWERFYKVDKAHTHGESGTGLGLSIIKRIIDEHEQAIRVKSEPGTGTAFTFSLSLAKDQTPRRNIGVRN